MTTQHDDFAEFVRATGRRIQFTALMLCGDHHLAEDLTQTTYAKVYVRWSNVSRMESPLAYTHTVLTHTFLSHRRLRRSSERPVEQLSERRARRPRPSRTAGPRGGAPPAAAARPGGAGPALLGGPLGRAHRRAARNPPGRLPPSRLPRTGQAQESHALPRPRPAGPPDEEGSAMTHLREEMYDAYASLHVDVDRLATQAQVEGGRLRRRHRRLAAAARWSCSQSSAWVRGRRAAWSGESPP